MENFVVSARKYRPATFNSVVGQPSITSTLKNAIRSNHLAQAFLFTGPRGVGKTTCARILAKTINCRNLTAETEACNECESCRAFNSSASFNIYELDAASNNSVDSMRTLIDQVRIPPQDGRYKVYIIDEVHMLSSQAFNAFLKTLEEPPAYAKFILATTEKHKILPTILSRCQSYDFKRITVDDIVHHLNWVASQEGIDAEQDALHIIARKADGGMRDSLSIFDQLVSYTGNHLTYQKVIESLNVLDHEYYFKAVDLLLAADSAGIITLFNQVIESGFDGQHFINGLGDHLRQLMLSLNPETLKLLEAAASIKQLYAEQVSRCSLQFLLQALDIVNKCDIDYRISNNKRLHIEIALLKMSRLVAAPEPALPTRPAPVSSPAPPPPRAAQPSSAPAPSPSATTPVQPGPSQATPPPSQAQPVQAQPASQPPRGMMGAAFGVGLKSIGVPKETKSDAEPAIEAEKRTPFSQEQLDAVWSEIVNSIPRDQVTYHLALSGSKPQLTENFVIEQRVDNKMQEEALMEHRPEIYQTLRQRLNNNVLQIQVVVSPQAEKAKVYTPVEKFNRMAEINPALNDLKTRFDLEIEG
ncbi:MAG: DNA polymerase III subunit gamma/tau [Bacteroidales bacterium]|nr:DNA polymerase III subunit gamma/tau [Bacteroidales bacterium]MDD3665071.1 DNA polymerase III subunit gamma/tau [Bacteroidales bacterium]